ncbi:tRNA uracil 4-sulfurtransferase ThiI [Paenibacillus thalictri]|uniref:Probable tRNA sulfurtransferase n=1 Tax=Paenibacillus thalictri TaxID=2527873 RepID=A0A4Q9DSQ3_9BACL|nr:tRNA uracil 4-sulfurtransferase ThiI [Paenibacillus thalictri]TBL78114.1 tRNA 4-thiouridine(8) synthase ThiI [Paenibacillus thalictri]
MLPDGIVIRLGELTLKGRNRHRFEHKIVKDIRRVTRAFSKIVMEQQFGRVYVTLNGEPYEGVAQELKKVFGLSSFSPVYYTESELDTIRSKALSLLTSESVKPGTFKVTVRRADKNFPYDSQEMNRLVGGYILQAVPGLKVDVHRPDVDIRVELREDRAFVYSKMVEGTGGFPLGTNGKALLMLSGGIDSPVAGWLAMKQGLELEAIHFHSYPYTSERSQEKVKDLVRKLAEYAGPVTLHMVPFTEIQTRLVQDYNDNLLITIMRRTMFRIAEQIAGSCGAMAIVTGESLGQVASQTLPSLHAIGQSVSIPVLQPLIFTDKQDIITIAEQIGTYPISILPHEDCCTVFLPPSPSTNPNLKVVQAIERSLPWLPELIEQTVQQTEAIQVGPGEPDRFENLF